MTERAGSAAPPSAPPPAPAPAAPAGRAAERGGGEPDASRRFVVRRRSNARARYAALVVYAAAMGWLEGVVVVYIRGLLGIALTETIPPAAEVMRRIDELPWLLSAEQTREAATLVMLGAVAWLGARSARARFGAFLVMFGVWDIVYYVALYAMLRWPSSLATMDMLFLLPPHPWWYQPVGLPVAISCVMIAAGSWLFATDGMPHPRAPKA